MMFVKKYSDVLNTHRKRGLRGLARARVLDCLSVYGASMTRGRVSPQVKVVVFHHLFGDEVDGFRALMEYLKERYIFVSIGKALQIISSGNIDKPYLAFTSDDGFRNNLKAAEILEEFGAKCCFYICPSMIGEKKLSTIREFNQVRLNMPAIEFLSWNDIEKLLVGGHEIGGHTMNHINLGHASQCEAAQEIGECYDVLEKRVGKAAHFAFPYGGKSDLSAASQSIIEQVGFSSIVSAQRGHYLPTVTDKSLNKCPSILMRHNVEFNWPLRHIQYLLQRGGVVP